MGSGQYAVAVGFVEPAMVEGESAGLNLIRSRVAMQRGDHEAAVALSTAVLQGVAPGSSESDHALLNLATISMHAGDAAEATRLLDRLASTSQDSHLHLITEAMRLMIAACGTGSLELLWRHLQLLADRQKGTYQHYYGVTMLNLVVSLELV